MSISLKEAAHRILRQKWRPQDINAAMQEIFAILQIEDTVTDGEEEHEHDGTNPSTTYKSYDYSDAPAISIQKLDRDTDEATETLTIDSSGITITTADGTSDSEGITVNGQTVGGGGFPGEVLSGTGSTYTVRITKSNGTQDVTVTQMQIASTETIPVGTKAIVAKVGSNYFMQVPVWL